MQKILTISIPTWNRASLLEKLLSELTGQISNLNLGKDITLLISNNSSDDNTDAVVKSFLGKYDFIRYNINERNIGGKSNVLKSMELADTPFVMFFGDDDNVNVPSLIEVIGILKLKNDAGVLLDTSISKFQYNEKIKKIDASELADNFYWYMGNAGCFILRTNYLKNYLTEFGYDFFNECWPQTQLMLLGLNENKDHAVYAGNLFISKESSHTAVMVYSSFYLWRTVVYDLRLSIESIRKFIDPGIYHSALSNMNKNSKQNFLNLLQCGVFIDEKELKRKTIKHIHENKNMFSGREKLLYSLVALILSLPGFINKPLSDLSIFLMRGKKGLQKKNDFVRRELDKKAMQNRNKLIVRELEFEK